MAIIYPNANYKTLGPFVQSAVSPGCHFFFFFFSCECKQSWRNKDVWLMCRNRLHQLFVSEERDPNEPHFGWEQLIGSFGLALIEKMILFVKIRRKKISKCREDQQWKAASDIRLRDSSDYSCSAIFTFEDGYDPDQFFHRCLICFSLWNHFCLFLPVSFLTVSC